MKRAPLQGWYAPAYAVAGVPMQERLAVAAARIARSGLAHFSAPTPLPPTMLEGLHELNYAQAFLHGIEPLASSQGVRWSPALRDAMLAMLGGQLAAVASAREHGIAFNLARGFHHAVPERGSGYCAINGLALVAWCCPAQRVLVIDCDEHGGNGTEEFSHRLDNLWCVSIFGTRFGCLGGPRSLALKVAPGEGVGQRYNQALDRAEDYLAAVKPDLVLYQAGADCHASDPKSSLRLSTHELFRRDLRVFRMARAAGVPLAFCVAGGYQRMQEIARLNTNTVRAAALAWCDRQ
ncbi:MAG TPA: hypothetical protein VFN09_03695 [Rhodanobacteraceae bacterium]|nr:hypothetical protein [Rhodanobacteraceae bacterium]